jgi:hypothetical protein
MHKGLTKLCIILFVLAICFILPATKPAQAQQAGYSHICYQTPITPTIDGQWSSDWNSGLQTPFGTNANFTDEWYLTAASPSSIVYYYLLIETMDNTNDTGDLIQICFNGAMTADSAPSPTDFAINFTSNEVCTWYQGNGTGWTQIATPPLSIFQWSESFSSSPSCSTPHLMLEMGLLKTSTDLGGTEIIGPEFWMLIKTYDANSNGYGFQSWPNLNTSSPEVPSTYGDIPYTLGEAPVSTGTSGPTATPTSTPTHTPPPTPTPTATPTTRPTSTPAQSPASSSTASPSPTPSPSPMTINTNSDIQSLSLEDTFFVLLFIGIESLIVVTHRARGKKQSRFPKNLEF